jgi:hypothetical protein
VANPPRRYTASQVQLTSTSTSDVKSSVGPVGSDHVLISSETNDARVTFDGSTPSSSNGHVVPKAAIPLYLPLGEGSTLKIVSTAAGTSLLNVTWINS